jgi:hypothetical protein
VLLAFIGGDPPYFGVWTILIGGDPLFDGR